MRPDPENIEVMVNMPKPSRGLFQYNRLPFGVSSSPAIFQRVIDNVLQKIPYVCAYLDDILVTGRTDEEHLPNLDKVLSRLAKAGMRLNVDKCTFVAPEVTYLGYRIDKEVCMQSMRKFKR